MEQIKIVVPDGWDDITIDQFQELAFLEGTEENKTIDKISILTDTDSDIIRKLPLDAAQKVLAALQWSNKNPSDAIYKPILRYDDKEFGLVSKFESFTAGEWLDLEEYFKSPIENIHLIMSILYRPLITAFNDRDRLIEDYDADVMQRQAEEFKYKVKIGDVYGVLVFFCLIVKECMKLSVDYLQVQEVLMKMEMGTL